MPTLWEIVTNNSLLPIDPGNNFWDHLNNQKQGAVYYPSHIADDIRLQSIENEISIQRLSDDVRNQGISDSIQLDSTCAEIILSEQD